MGEKMEMDFSTVDVERLAKECPKLKLPPTYYLGSHLGAGCSGDPPGYPSHFVQYIWTSHGNSPARGPTTALCGYGLPTDDTQYCKMLARVYKKLSIEHPQVQQWIVNTFVYLNHMYVGEHADEHGDKQFVWPLPAYRLRYFHDDPRFNDEWRASERAAVAAYNANLMAIYSQWANVDCHMATRRVREYYPEYTPGLKFMQLAETGGLSLQRGNWCDRYAEQPTLKNCPGERDRPHPVNGSWCQLCGMNRE